MRSRRVLVDSNVLVYAAVPDSPYCLRERSTLLSLEGSESAVYISRQIIREFLVAMSRMRDGQWQQDQLFNAARTLESHYIVAEEHPVVSEQLYLLLGQVPCGGKLQGCEELGGDIDKITPRAVPRLPAGRWNSRV